MECFDNVKVERDLIKSFEETFTKVGQYGNEYFEGDPEDMKVLICSSLNLSYNTKTTCTKKYETEYNVIKAKNQALDLKYETLDLKNEAMKQSYDKMKQSYDKMKNAYTEKNIDTFITETNKNQCSKCLKVFTSVPILRKHEKKCDGYNKKQCKICLRMFVTRQGKHEHIKYVKCKPPID
jgi:hypothetical protein